MTSIREALRKQRQEECAPRVGGGFWHSRYLEKTQRSRAPYWVALGAIVVLLGGAATAYLQRERLGRLLLASPPAPLAAPTSTPTPEPTATPTLPPTPTPVPPTPQPDHSSEVLDRLESVQRELAELRARQVQPRVPAVAKPPAAPPRAPAAPPFRLEGTIGRGEDIAAIIGGNIIKVGGVVNGRRITEIGQNWVRCEGYPGTIQVEGKSATRTPTPPEPAREE